MQKCRNKYLTATSTSRLPAILLYTEEYKITAVLLAQA